MSLNQASSAYQQCTPQCPLDFDSIRHSTDSNAHYAIQCQFFNSFLAINTNYLAMKNIIFIQLSSHKF